MLLGTWFRAYVLSSELTAERLRGIWMGRTENWVMPVPMRETLL